MVNEFNIQYPNLKKQSTTFLRSCTDGIHMNPDSTTGLYECVVRIYQYKIVFFILTF